MAKTKPQTEQKTTLKSWSEVDQLLKAIASIESKKMQEESAMNDKILRANQDHMPTLDKLNAEKLGYERDIQLYCDGQKDEFKDARSKTLNYGVVGFRKGTGALKTLKGFTWEAVKKVIEASKKYSAYIKTKTDIDKNAILSSDMKPDQMAKLGVQVVQEDSFYYEAYLKSSSEQTVSK